jgi:hypothetical protein
VKRDSTKEAVMDHDAARTAPEPHPAAPRGEDLPHAYFIEEARWRRTGTLHHLADRRAKPEDLSSSACFDAWAKDEDAA